MGKDALGHGSEKRGDAYDEHQAARNSIKMHPDAKNPQAENTLRSLGYKDSDIQRLRQLAGGAVPFSSRIAHQTGVEVARTTPSFALSGIEPSTLRKVAGV